MKTYVELDNPEFLQPVQPVSSSPPGVPARRVPTPTVALSAIPGTAAVEEATQRRSRGRGLGLLPSLALGALALVAWELVTRLGLVPEFLLPPPLAVLHSLWHGLVDGMLLDYARTTVVESLAGFALGTAIALPMGYAVARSRLLARALEPYLAASQAVPAVALAPLLVLWLGYGLAPVALLCALIVFFPTVVNTALGLRTIDPEPLDAARVDGAGRWSLLLHMELPLALPSILAGMRTSLTLSVTGAVVGEFVLGDRGLGGLLTIARGNFDTPLVFATLVTLIVLAAALYGVARLVERRLSYLDA